MTGPSRLTGSRGALAVALVALLSTGCSFLDGSGASHRNGRRSASSSSSSSSFGREGKPKGPIDNFIAITAKKGDGAFAFNRFGRDLWTPFTWEVTLGSMDADHPVTFPSIMCTELDVKGSNPLEFYLLCAQPQGNGSMLVYAGSHNGTGDFLVFQGTTEVDMRILSNGGNLEFWARPRDSGGYQLVDTISYSQSGEPLVPSIGASNLSGGAVAGFDLLRVVENGFLPDSAGREHGADDVLREDIWVIGDAALEAWYQVDGGDPDTEGAKGVLTGVIADIEGMLDEEDFKSSKARKKAGKGLKKAAKKFAGAIKKIDKGTPASKVWKDIGKGMKSLLWNLPALDDHSF